MKRTLIVSASMVLLALCVMLIGFNLPEDDTRPLPDPTLLLVEDDTGVFFRQLRLGAQKATGETASELTTETVRMADLPRMQAAWVSRSYRGAIVYIENSELRQSVLDALDEARIPAVVIGHWDGEHTALCWDEADLGQKAASLATRADKVYIAGGSAAARQAAMATLGKRAVERDALDVTSPTHAIITLDPETTQSLCAEKEAGGWQCALYGLDPGESRVHQLEQGVAQALLFGNPYAAGYRAASEGLSLSGAHLYNMAHFTVLPQNMYDAQNVKLVFPLLN